jgi:hypothetical protein
VDQAVGGIDLTGLATEDYVDTAIGNIEIPEVDLTGLATEDYVDTAISNIDLNLPGDLIPAADITYDIGSEDFRWRDLYLSGDTIYLGTTPVSVNNGKLLVGNTIVSTSVAQLSWTAITLDASTLPQVSGGFNTVAYGGGTFIATNSSGNNNKAVYSTDGGVTWTLFELPYTRSSNLALVGSNPLTYGNGTWLLSFSQTNQRQTATSSDGINWTVHANALPNENPNAELDPLHEWMGTIFSDRFVMFSSGVRSVQNSGFPRIISSPDGINWTGHNPILGGQFGIPVAPSIGYDGTGPWYMTGLAWGNNTYVGIGQGYNTVGGGIAGNQFYYSTTLNSWVQVIVPISVEWRQIRFGNGAFIAWGFPSNVSAVRSTDNGLTWERITLPPGIVDIEYGQGRWIAITSNTFANQGQHAYSLDNGTTWVPFNMPAVQNLYGYSAIAFDGTTFCTAGGDDGNTTGEFIAISTITTNAVEEDCCYNDNNVFDFVSTNLVKFNRTIDTFTFPEGPFGLGSIAIYDFATQGAVWVHNGGTDAPYTPNFVNLPVIAETTVVCTLVFLAPIALPLTNVLIEGNEIEGVMRGLGGDNPIADGVSDYIVSYTFIRGSASWLRVFVSVTQFSETSPTPPPEEPPPS